MGDPLDAAQKAQAALDAANKSAEDAKIKAQLAQKAADEKLAADFEARLRSELSKQVTPEARKKRLQTIKAKMEDAMNKPGGLKGTGMTPELVRELLDRLTGEFDVKAPKQPTVPPPPW